MGADAAKFMPQPYRICALKLSGLPEVTTSEQRGADAELFLRRVMNDESVPMALRIEAAKVLLGYAKRS